MNSHLKNHTDAYGRAASEIISPPVIAAGSSSSNQIQLHIPQPNETTVPRETAAVAAPNPNHASPHSNTSPYSQEAGGGSLAPAGVLSVEAMTGDFSLVNVFKVPGSSTENYQNKATVRRKSVVESKSDPTVLGVVSMPIARNLFDS